jgi:hypothetical protein
MILTTNAIDRFLICRSSNHVQVRYARSTKRVVTTYARSKSQQPITSQTRIPFPRPAIYRIRVMQVSIWNAPCQNFPITLLRIMRKLLASVGRISCKTKVNMSYPKQVGGPILWPGSHRTGSCSSWSWGLISSALPRRYSVIGLGQWSTWHLWW